MNGYQRIFGTGPRGLAISVILLLACFNFEQTAGLPQIHNSAEFGISSFALAIVLTLVLVIWSIGSLLPEERGRIFITSGAFRYFRHPLYAAFLTFFNFGLALYLNNYLFLIWAVIGLPKLDHLNS